MSKITSRNLLTFSWYFYYFIFLQHTWKSYPQNVTPHTWNKEDIQAPFLSPSNLTFEFEKLITSTEEEAWTPCISINQTMNAWLWYLMGGKGFYLDLIGWARSRDAIIRGITGKKHIGGGSFLCSRTRGGARGGTLIEINLDIYSRQSAGYTGHCTSINAPTYLQLQPGDITFELIIHDRGIRGIRNGTLPAFFCFRVYIRVPWLDIGGGEPSAATVIYGGGVPMEKIVPVDFSTGTKICRNYRQIRSHSMAV